MEGGDVDGDCEGGGSAKSGAAAEGSSLSFGVGSGSVSGTMDESTSMLGWDPRSRSGLMDGYDFAGTAFLVSHVNMADAQNSTFSLSLYRSFFLSKQLLK